MKLRARLEQERDSLSERTGSGAAQEEEAVELQDAAATEDSRQREIRLLGHDRARLDQVLGALSRMDDGSYGVCEETGEPIPFARLEIEPTTVYTVEAAESLELPRGRDDGSRDDPGAY